MNGLPWFNDVHVITRNHITHPCRTIDATCTHVTTFNTCVNDYVGAKTLIVIAIWNIPRGNGSPIVVRLSGQLVVASGMIAIATNPIMMAAVAIATIAHATIYNAMIEDATIQRAIITHATTAMTNTAWAGTHYATCINRPPGGKFLLSQGQQKELS